MAHTIFKAGDKVRAHGASVLRNIFLGNEPLTVIDNPYFPNHSKYPLIIQLQGWADPFHFTETGHYLPDKNATPDLVKV